MAGANPQRTSWTPEEVRGNLSPVWYRPIEPYISQNVQIIAAEGLLYISTARGLYALRADNGDIAWIYPTELPLGHSPTYDNGILYVGGFDRKLHAIDALTGMRLWTFDEAKAGYRTNPLVVNGLVLLGNRDGWFYAIHAHGTPNQGTLAWKYKTEGPILYSAAYKKDKDSQDIIFFASQDMHAYALYANTGQLKWKSEKLHGAGFHSWWPVIWNDKVVLTTAANYRDWMNPGASSCDVYYPPGHWGEGEIIENYHSMEGTELQASGLEYIEGTEPGDWVAGTKTIDTSCVTQYFEKYPWRRSIYLLDIENGADWGFDYDGDGKPEYAPISWHGTHNGIRPVPMVSGFDNVLYQFNGWDMGPDGVIVRGNIAGWKMGTPFISRVASGSGAWDEPRIASGGGSMVYWSHMDRGGGWIDISKGWDEAGREGRYPTGENMWPGFHEVWQTMTENIQDGAYFVAQYYDGRNRSINGIYGNHGGEQSPFIPYQGHIYMLKDNCVFSSGPEGGAEKLPLAEIQQPLQEQYSVFSENELKQMLADQISEWLEAGHLQPGWFNGSLFHGPLNDYFQNPAENLWALLRALPHLPPEMQQAARDLIQSEYQAYDPTTYQMTGWSEGVTRDWFLYPPEVEADLQNFGPSTKTIQLISWWNSLPPMNFYALWKYAEEFGGGAGIFNAVKNKLTSPPGDTTKQERPYELNAYIAGYWGYLELEKQAGQAESTSVRDTLNSMLAFRLNNFSKDLPVSAPRVPNVSEHYISISRNFMFMTPELGQYLHDNALSQVEEAFDQYEYLAPYWFVSRYEAMWNEGTIQNLNDYPALFQTKAWILQDSREELVKYLDVPAFMRGDLFYIHNLISAIEAQPATEPQPQPTLTGDLNNDGVVNILDLVIVGNSFSKEPGQAGYDSRADSNNSGGVIDIFDLILVGSNFGKSI